MKNISLKQVILFLAVTLLALTPFYGLAYLVVIVVAAKYLGFSKIFDTLFARIVLSVIILSVTIMITGMAMWLINTIIHPVVILALFASIVYLLRHFQTVDYSSPKFFSKKDTLSLSLALVSVVIMATSFFFPKPTSSSAIQIVTNGIDGSAHLSLLRSLSVEKGYIYGTEEDTKGKVMQDSGSYPQGWHLATSHIASGFGANPFASDKPITVVISLLAIIAVWYILSIYIFTRISWQLMKNMSKIAKNNAKHTTVLFIIANLVIQLLVLWPPLRLGFLNYMGCIVFALIAVAMVVDRRNKSDNDLSYFLAATLAAIAVAQSWLLPAPAIVAMIFLGFFVTDPLISFAKIRSLRRFIKDNLPALLTTTFLVACIAFQAAILLAYSVTSPAEQLITKGGASSVGKMLFSIVTVTTLLGWIYLRPATKKFEQKAITIIAPITLLCAAIYTYQLFESDTTSYYLTKSLGLALCLVGLFFIPAFVALIQKIPTISKGFATLTAILLLCLLFVGTGQTTSPINFLFQKNASMTYETSSAVDAILKDATLNKQPTIILRGYKLNEDLVGSYFYSRLTAQQDECTASLLTLEKQTIKNRLTIIDECTRRTNTKMTVITSRETNQMIQELKNPHLHIVYTP